MNPATDPVGDAAEWMLVGVVAAPVGVRGEVKIDLATEFPDRFKLIETIYVGEEHRPMELAGARRHAGRVALRFAAIADRDAAEPLRGQPLYIPRAEAMPLPEGHYYHDQIIGLRVVTTAGEALGTVQQILPTGANDVYVVRDEQREVLVPAIRDVVRRIDVEAGLMEVEAIEGLL